MSNLCTDAPAVFIVVIAGVFALCALIISKFCSFSIRRKFKSQTPSAYECGFNSAHLHTFFAEKSPVISIFLLSELLFFWLLSCVTVVHSHFVSIYAIALIFFLFLSARCIIHKEAHK